jgi:hypothetical protein
MSRQVPEIPHDERGRRVEDALALLRENYAEARVPQNIALIRHITILAGILGADGIDVKTSPEDDTVEALVFNGKPFKAHDTTAERDYKNGAARSLAMSLAVDFASQCAELGVYDLLFPVPTIVKGTYGIVGLMGSPLAQVTAAEQQVTLLRIAGDKPFMSGVLERYAQRFGIYDDPIEKSKVMFPPRSTT